jgi:undecaprenyl-diphosphatase
MIWPVAALTLIVIVALRRWTVALLVLLGSTGGLLLGELLLKPLVARPRPSPDLVRVLDPATSYGFPSSTSLLAAIMTGLVVALVPQSRRSLAFVPGMAVVLLIGLARIYVGEHWPTDIAASWCFAGAWLLLLRAVWAFFPALNPDVSRR